MSIRTTSLWVAAAAIAGLIVGCAQEQAGAPPPSTAETTPVDDERVATYVQARYQTDPELRGSDVDVSVESGVATLRGTVPSSEVRERAAAMARQVDGVRSVEDQLQVAASRQADAEPASGSAAGGAAPARTAADDRSPGWITTKIRAQYFLNPEVKPWNIDVTTSSNGTVTLRGEVEDAKDREEAVRIAKATDGVTGVEDQLRVKGESRDEPATPSPATAQQMRAEESDAWLTAKIQAKYFVDPDVKGRNINVDTRTGVVTLTGEVESESERRQAVAIARNTDGVQSVNDQLKVRPADTAEAARPLAKVDDVWITTKIQSQFFLDQNINGRDINVDVRDGVVTLKGTVDSEVEKKAALTIASETDGVSRVIDQIKVAATSAR